MIVSTSRGSTVRSFDERRAILTAVKRDRRNPPPKKKEKKTVWRTFETLRGTKMSRSHPSRDVQRSGETSFKYPDIRGIPENNGSLGCTSDEEKDDTHTHTHIHACRQRALIFDTLGNRAVVLNTVRTVMISCRA